MLTQPKTASPPNAQALSSVLLDLYRLARESDVAAFQRNALALLGHHVAFDGCLWGAGTMANGFARLRHAHVWQLSSSAVDLINRTGDQNLVAQRCLNQPGIAHVFDTQAMAAHEGTLDVAVHLGFSQVLCIADVDAVTQLVGSVSLVRRSAYPSFSDAERAWLALLMPHLQETLNLARLGSLLSARYQRTAQGALLAITDASGLLHVMEPGFALMLREEWSDWVGPWLPSALPPHDDIASVRWSGQSISIDIEGNAGMRLVTLRRRSPADQLSPQERAVALAYAEGHSYKVVARTLGIAPATVRHHLRRVYTRLGIDNKTALAKCLAEAKKNG